ncbi:MAG: DUF4870 domain-containing protein [Desulfobacterales bacterium]|jgi:hypothetical protein
MSGMLYNVDFSGRIIPGWELEEVKSNLTKVLKADDETIFKLFSGNRIAIKKNVDHQTALKINNVFKEAGADCMISPVKGSSATAPPPLPAQSAPMDVAAPVPSTQDGTAVKPSPAAAHPRPAATNTGPGRFWYAVAVLLFLVPMIAGGTTLFNTVQGYLSTETRLVVPGETDIQIHNPGTYYFLYETSAYSAFNVANNRLGRDFDIYLMDLATGQELTLAPAEIPYTEENGSKILQAIAQVRLDTLGSYGVTVYGDIPGKDSLVVRRFELWEMVNGFIWGGVLIFIGFLAGPITGLVVLVKRQKQTRPQADASLSEDEENNWAMWAHISTFCSMIVPLGNFIGPFVVWQLKKNESEFVADQAKEALNFQISLFIYMLISAVLILIVIGFFLIIGLALFGLIIVIVAGVKANQGEYYRYPMCLRLIPQKKYPQ